MGKTPSGHDSESVFTQELQMEDTGLGDPSTQGFMHYSNNAFRNLDGASAAAYDPRWVWAALDAGPFDGYVSGAYKQVLPTGAIFPTQIIWWTSSAMTVKIAEKLMTYTGAFPTQIVHKTYSNGTLLHAYTDTITYSGAAESTRTRTWT